MHRRAVSCALGACLVCIPLVVLAESEHREPGHEPEQIVVTGSPLEKSADDLSQPVDVVTGDELVLDVEPTLGETLALQPGLSSSYFGPGASRPIIRGLDADHIRVLHNGLGAFDASAASADHAVTIDPLATERIEIVRGPMALLYGPTGVGGVVNVIDNRIPDEPIDGVGGAFQGALDSAARGRAGSGMVEAGVGGFSVHADGVAHRSRDLTIPKGKLENSRIDTYASSLGVSWAGERGYLGVAPSGFDSNYGTVAEPDVTIDMRQRRWDFAGALNEPLRGIDTLRGKIALSDYEHVEFEGPDPGTKFANRGYEARLELLHAPLGPATGAIGGQAYRSKFSATGAEAFLPPSTTRAWSVFVVEEMARGPLTFQFGARLDWTDISTETAPEPFGAGQDRNRRTGSGALGATWDFDDEWAASFSYAYTQRPPLAQELFADGPHVATDTFEVGDPDLDVEQSFGFDASLKKRTGIVTGSLNGFYYYFEDFIGLVDTDTLDPVDGLPVFQYANLPATFLGGEAEITLHLLETNEHSAHLDLRADYVRARDRETGDPLPRIPPLRLGAELAYHRGPLHLSGGVRFAAAQHRTADFETDTGSYVLLDASLAYELTVRSTRALLFLNATNLSDQTARNSASFLKEIAPLPGRALRTGVRVTF